ncbi:BMP family lipoprotein [Fluviispira multicolorata]|uniref:BMP family ABC transporter substrate-binding protein n=1 Tax=Fluviispira multicolorata TaxID=2654512 RepID=A0A833JI64_9BACT|nr:BMP family ABC transporter substrate-binding protein [Fluviispira multicolorata]KAB8033792.1 BMP family ABC transporter substrate-binding protein [Fluviispira multicolorata]
MKKIIFLSFILNLFPSFSFAENVLAKPRICMVLDRGGKDDKSFNESAVNGFQKAMDNLQISAESKFLEIHSDAQIEQFLRAFSIDSTCSLIITIGFNPSSYVKKFAEKYSNKKYLTIDHETISSHKNVRSALFREDEGAFLMGSIAAIKSKSKKIGMIGGMDIPMMKRFALSYEAGAKHVSSKVHISKSIIGPTPEAWNNPAKAKELALAQIAQGVDVIFQVAGPSGMGVFDAIKQARLKENSKPSFAIGVDSNQNGIAPKLILTSMEKHVDMAVYSSIEDLVNHKFIGNIKQYDLRNGGIDWSFDNNNKPLFSGFEIQKINRIRAAIIEGIIKVPDYYVLAKKDQKRI